MKTQVKLPIIISFLLVFIFSSCRSELTENIDNTKNPALKENSAVANLMQQTSLNDGSNDNIIDNASCFNITLPITVIVNGVEILVETEDDYDVIENIFDEDDEDEDTIEINFPVTIVLSDFTEVIINNKDELESYIDSDCNDGIDDDIECVDFVYPISASIFNKNNELIETITVTNDEEMYDFIEDLDDDIIVNINFPISIFLPDGSEQVINNLNELENAIENAKDDCDEDDDNDFDDDDCIDCTQQQVLDLLTTCSDWVVDELELNGNDLEDNYVGYTFNFSSDGTLTVQESSNNFSGTWSSSGTGENIIIIINIPSLPDFNANWELHEIEKEDGEAEIELKLGEDELEFESICN
ncbi:MAG: hypothetical protein L3J20_04405 [Flavobacteriaceae bacterium]|nr:hypothetical protein [Flavobacteriaceae bacterium]